MINLSKLQELDLDKLTVWECEKEPEGGYMPRLLPGFLRCTRIEGNKTTGYFLTSKGK